MPLSNYCFWEIENVNVPNSYEFQLDENKLFIAVKTEEITDFGKKKSYFKDCRFDILRVFFHIKIAFCYRHFLRFRAIFLLFFLLFLFSFYKCKPIGCCLRMNKSKKDGYRHKGLSHYFVFSNWRLSKIVIEDWLVYLLLFIQLVYDELGIVTTNNETETTSNCHFANGQIKTKNRCFR